MQRIKPISNKDKDGYYSVIDSDGVLRCSCGRELIKLDEGTYKCSGGYPIYSFDEGTIFIDKFGNLMLKKLDHGNGNNNLGRQQGK